MSGSTDRCYLVYNQNTEYTLKRSQELCSLAQSNIAVFESDPQIKDFICKYYKLLLAYNLFSLRFFFLTLK